MPEGGANIAETSVALPHSEFVENAHFKTICTRVQRRPQDYFENVPDAPVSEFTLQMQGGEPKVAAGDLCV
jgi:hypothetical protein